MKVLSIFSSYIHPKISQNNYFHIISNHFNNQTNHSFSPWCEVEHVLVHCLPETKKKKPKKKQMSGSNNCFVLFIKTCHQAQGPYFLFSIINTVDLPVMLDLNIQ